MVAVLIGDFVSVLLGFGTFILIMWLIFVNRFTKILVELGLSIFWALAILNGSEAGLEWAIVTLIGCLILNLMAIEILNKHV